MNRYWCARGQYPGKEPFLFGSVLLPADARHDEVEAAIVEAWHSVSPHAPPPFSPMMGTLIFQENTK